MITQVIAGASVIGADRSGATSIPHRVTRMKRATSTLLVLVGVAVLLSGCGNAADIWRSEFDARLEGAVAAIQESEAEFAPTKGELDVIKAGLRLGPRLAFKSELIKHLDAPDHCVQIEEKGWRSVWTQGELVNDLYKNMTPYLRMKLMTISDEEVAELRSLEREAEACA